MCKKTHERNREGVQMLKRISAFIILIIALMSLSGCSESAQSSKREKLEIVTSFYPMYIAALNITKGIEKVEISNLTDNNIGCLHDYNLTTSDLIKIEKADVFILNGLGVENFEDKIFSSYPNIKIINSSDGIEAGDNGHIWLSVNLHKRQIQNICYRLCEIDTENEERYRSNAEEYIAKLDELNIQIMEEAKVSSSKNAVCLNDAFEYLGQDLNINLNLLKLGHDEENGLSAANIAELVSRIKRDDIKFIFIEKLDSDKTAKTIAHETDIQICRLDAVFSGEYDENAYINAMLYNLSVLGEIYGGQ